MAQFLKELKSSKFSQFPNSYCSAWLRLKLNTRIGLHTTTGSRITNKWMRLGVPLVGYGDMATEKL